MSLKFAVLGVSMEPIQNPTERDWREEFITRLRFPRAGWAAVSALVCNSANVKILVNEQAKCTDVILRFPSSSRQLPEAIRKAYARSGTTIEEAFNEVLWKKPLARRSTLWSEIARSGYKAYREAWLHLLQTLYLGHFHPDADEWLRQQLEDLKKVTRRSLGRRADKKEENDFRQRRFKSLLARTQKLHQLVQRCVDQQLAEPAIRKAVFAELWGSRIDAAVLNRQDSAFGKIIYATATKEARLHDPHSWTPRQLAKALFALESGRQYGTIEKEFAEPRKQRRKTASRK
jgi:hypothetical protein